MSDSKDPIGIKPESINLDSSKFIETGSMLKSDDKLLSQIYQTNGQAFIDAALTSTMYGIDIFGVASPAQLLQEQYGLTFFTRPMLNLSQDNITNDPTLMHMASKESMSIGRYVRAMLDPLGDHECPLVDNTNTFMPLLSNTLETLAGWQDPILDTYQSPSGLKKESWSIGDSTNKVYQTMQLSSTFRNTRGNVITYLFHVWQTYIALAYEGIVSPIPEMIRYNTIDYQSRIYRLTLDNTRTYVQELTCCGAAFPLVNNVGVRSNYNRSSVMNTEGDMYSQTWQAMGAFYFDPRMIQAFNTVSAIRKPNWKIESTRTQNYRLLTPSEYRLFSYRAFPQINLKTSMLEWWVDLPTYKTIINTYA